MAVMRVASNAVSFADQLRDVPPKIRRNLNPRLRKVAGRIVSTARGNASWSSRIPGAISVRSGARTGVQIVVSKAQAPHGRLYEFGQDRRGFRHPVFGNTDVWVQQETRPYLVPALRRHGDDVVKEIQAAITDAWPH